MLLQCLFFIFFFFNDPATTEIYTLPLHDALPIFRRVNVNHGWVPRAAVAGSLKQILPLRRELLEVRDRKSTRLNSSHTVISYAVFCLKKKKIVNNKASNEQAKPRHNT